MIVIKGNNGFDHHLTSVRGVWESLMYRLEATALGWGVVARQGVHLICAVRSFADKDDNSDIVPQIIADLKLVGVGIVIGTGWSQF